MSTEIGPLPEGPHFQYDGAPELFLGRRGRGPLEVAWDTNVLIDYLTHGPAMWEGEPLEIEHADAEEVEALDLLIQVWQVRDVRFTIFPRSIDDARRALARERRYARAKAVDEFAAALTLTAGEEEDDAFVDGPSQQPLPLQLPTTLRDQALSRVPEGADRELVGLALAAGVHVFLTRDRGVLAARENIRPHGLLLASPLDLLEELAACGALLCVLRRETTYWPIPDVQRMAHLVQALGD